MNGLLHFGEDLKKFYRDKIACHWPAKPDSLSTDKSILRGLKKSEIPAILATQVKDELPIIIFSNEAHEKLTGYSMEELIGKSTNIFYGKNTDKHSLKDLIENLKENGFWTGKLVCYDKRGKECLISFNIITILVNNKRYHIAYKKRLTK
jgi:PAS domain S-box-containing protein